MKKVLKAIGSVLIIAFACILGAVGGFILSTMLFSGDFTIPEIAVVILGIALAFYVSLIIHEGGHLLFGLLSGYGFSSFRIGNFMWIKQDEGIKLRRLSIAGTGGQCLMTPPENKEGKIPVVLYNLGGVFAKGDMDKKTRYMLMAAGLGAALWILFHKGDFFGYRSISACLMAAGIFAAVSGLSVKPSRTLLSVSQCTWGIYLIHPLFLHAAIKGLHIDFLSPRPFLQLSALCAGLFLLSFAATWILRRIPVIKKLF